MFSKLLLLVVCFLSFSGRMEASTTTTIVTTSSTTTTTTNTDPTTSTSQNCPSVPPPDFATPVGTHQEKFLRLSVDPVVITEGRTSKLSVNCTFWATPQAEVKSLFKIIIVRLRDLKSIFGLEKQEMAIATPGPGHNKTTVHGGLTVTRTITSNGLSYLNITINAPTSKDEGLYRCSVLGLDTLKEPFLAQALMGVGPYGSDKLAPPTRVGSTASPEIGDRVGSEDASPQIRKQIDTMQSAFDVISEKVTGLENFRTSVDARLAYIKDSLFEFNTSYPKSQYVISRVDFSSAIIAQATCELFGGFLAEVDTLEEFQNMIQFAAENLDDKVEAGGAVEGVLIGGSFNEEDKSWINRFSVNNAAHFQWRDGYPTTDPTKKCIVLLKEHDWDMTNQACRNEKSPIKFMCEVPHRK